ncbi:MAG TPA: hypothetical protein VGS41_02940 [Chthonomonadales bacterium]|nr:hypothetical protein [Chthonomonadales bacterium]
MATKTCLVAIAGGSASGKTTLAKAISEELAGRGARVEVTGMDRYFYRGAPGPTFISPTTGEEMPNNNHPDSADNARLLQDIDALVASEAAPDVVIVEGLMALHIRALRERTDLRLFVELEEDVRALRRLLRDMGGGRGNRDPHFIAAYYRECAKPGHAQYVEPSRIYADFILRGDADFARVAQMLGRMILARAPE